MRAVRLDDADGGRLMPPPRALRRLRALWALGVILGERPPEAAEINWPDTLRLADEQLVTPAVAVAVRRHPGFSAGDAALARLDQAHRQNLARNMMLRAQVLDMVRCLNAAGVEPLLIKGALYFFDGTLPDLGARMTGDIDVVIPEVHWEGSIQALKSRGYVAEAGKPFLHPHELPMVAPGLPAMIELHRELGSSVVAQVLPVFEAWRDSAAFTVDGGCFRGLSSTHAALHNVLHAELQDLNHAVFGIAVRQLHTLLCLQRARGAEIDWEAIGDRMRHFGATAAYRGYLDLAGVLFGMRLPLRPGPRATGHSLASLLAFQLRWPSDVYRNVRFALGADYLDHLYNHGGRPARLLAARAKHLYRVACSGGRAAMSDAFVIRR